MLFFIFRIVISHFELVSSVSLAYRFVYVAKKLHK